MVPEDNLAFVSTSHERGGVDLLDGPNRISVVLDGLASRGAIPLDETTVLSTRE